MFQPDHAQHTGETVHHDDRVQYLVAGDETSLAEVEAELALLPLCARGRVFIEVPSPEDVSVLNVPVRMTVSWLTRSTRAGRPGTAEGCAPGEALARAVRGWAAEMLCDGPGATRALLSGDYRGVSEAYEYLVHEIGMADGSVTTPAAFGLRASR